MSFIQKAGKNYNPNKIDRLIVSSRPGMGKTELLMSLPDTIYFDLEGSSGYFKGNCDVVDIKARMATEKVGMLTAIKNTITDIKTAGLVYRFAVIDTISKIDELAEIVATVKYKNSIIGKDFKGDSVVELGYGAGYTLLKSEFQNIIDMFEDLAEHKIYVCHIKDSSIPKDGTQLAINDIKLTGSLKEIFSAKQDAAAMLEIHPDDPNVRILNFDKTEVNAFIKCRAQHLAGKKVIVSRKVDGKLETYLDDIYLELKKK